MLVFGLTLNCDLKDRPLFIWGNKTVMPTFCMSGRNLIFSKMFWKEQPKEVIVLYTKKIKLYGYCS